MKKNIIISLIAVFILFPFKSYSAVNSVNEGNLISASKINELITEINLLRTQLDSIRNKRHIVATSLSGTTWYEVYSDGWVRQGFFNGAQSDTQYTTNWSIPFRDTNYIVTVGRATGSLNVNLATRHLSYKTKQATSITYHNYSAIAFECVAEGFGNSSSVTNLGASPSY